MMCEPVSSAVWVPDDWYPPPVKDGVSSLGSMGGCVAWCERTTALEEKGQNVACNEDLRDPLLLNERVASCSCSSDEVSEFHIDCRSKQGLVICSSISGIGSTSRMRMQRLTGATKRNIAWRM